MRFFLLNLVFISLLLGSTKIIDKKIQDNKNTLKENALKQEDTTNKIKELADKITANEGEYKKIDDELKLLSNSIFLNKLKLEKVKVDIVKLKEDTLKIQQQTQDVQNNIIDEIINKYSSSLAMPLAKKETQQEVVDKEVFGLLLQQSKENVMQLNLEYLKLTADTRHNEDKIVELGNYITEQEEKKIRVKQLKEQKQDSILKLTQEHKLYQEQLQNIIDKQNHIQDLLANLNILKDKEIKEEALKQKRLREQRLKDEQAKKDAMNKKRQTTSKQDSLQAPVIEEKEMSIGTKQQLDDDINIKIKNIGSSTRGIKISKYNGEKTIAPLKDFTITKKFGKYYDPVYKIELFNEAISMKTQEPNAKVYNIMPGKIVYAKENSGALSNVVIIQHANGLHTIYSNLDRIAPTLKVGKWIKQGFVVGRVSDTLMFQATKNSKYIDPTELFR